MNYERNAGVETEVSDFDEAACIQATFRDQAYSQIAPFSREGQLAQQFLLDDIYRRRYNLRLRSTTVELKRVRKQTIDRPSITVDELTLFEQHTIDSLSSTGHQFKDEAAAEGKLGIVPQRVLQAFSFKGQHQNPLADLSFQFGWDILPVRRDDGQSNFLFVMPDLPGDDQHDATFWATNLGSMHQANPAATLHLIREFINKQILYKTAVHAQDNVSFHMDQDHRDIDALIDGILSQDFDTRVSILSNISDTLRHFWKVRDDKIEQQIARFQAEINPPITLPSGRTVNRNHQIIHKVQCPSEAEQARIQARRTSALLFQMGQIALNAPSILPQDPDGADIDINTVLKNPHVYTKDVIDENSERTAQKISQSTELETYFRTLQTTPVDQFDSQLAEISPELATLFQDFRNTAGRTFQNEIDQVAHDMLEKDSNQYPSILLTLTRRFSPTYYKGKYGQLGKFIADKGYGQPQFRSSELGQLMTAYTLAHMRDFLNQRDDQLVDQERQKITDEFKRMAEDWKAITARLKVEQWEAHKKKAAAKRAGLLDSDMPTAAHVFPDNTQLTQEEIATYKVLANLRYLNKTGKLDLNSPSLHLFITHLFPQFPPDKLTLLQDPNTVDRI